MESSIRGKHKESSHIPPANLFLKYNHRSPNPAVRSFVLNKIVTKMCLWFCEIQQTVWLLFDKWVKKGRATFWIDISKMMMWFLQTLFWNTTIKTYLKYSKIIFCSLSNLVHIQHKCERFVHDWIKFSQKSILDKAHIFQAQRLNLLPCLFQHVQTCSTKCSSIYGMLIL